MSETQNALRPSRAVRWAVGVGTAIMAAIALVLFFLLTLTTNNRVLYERNYGWLFGVNVVVALLLLAVLLWVAVRLLLRLRRGRFGSRLLVKLAAIFALVGLMPGLLIYYVSYQFVSRSIESWFDVKVEGALAAGVSLASATLEMQVSETAARARSLSAQLSQTSDATAGLVLERIRDQLGASDLLLWNAAGQLVASVGQSRYRLDQERPTAQQLRTVRQQRAIGQLEGLDELPDVTRPEALRNVRVSALVLVPNPGMGLVAEPRYLQAVVPLPPVLVDNAVAVQEAGAVAVVLEMVPARLASKISKILTIPTIGIGAGDGCDGQVLVWTDMAGMTSWSPSFSKQFGRVGDALRDAATDYCAAVKSRSFPDDSHSF